MWAPKAAEGAGGAVRAGPPARGAPSLVQGLAWPPESPQRRRSGLHNFRGYL